MKNNLGYKILSISLTIIVIVIVIAYSPKGYYSFSPFHSCSSTYVSGTGTAGSANTAQTIITRALTANTLIQVGDRIRIRVYSFANAAAPIIATAKINGVSIANLTISSAIVPVVVECYLHYIDNTHANVLEVETGALGSLSAVNVAGFSWNSSQNITVEQSAVVGNFVTVYGIFVDVLPKYVS